MKHTMFWILVSFAFILAMNTVSADIYLGYGNSDFYFEIYSGNSYHYADVPYTYAQNNYYYFDYPYRVYSSGTYHYYESGWYAYDDYWRFAPDNYSYYTYYPSNYYYYNYTWYYYPNWVTYYAPTYYGSYYYPPRTQATQVGQNYHYEETSNCGEVNIETSTVSVSAGQEKEVHFYIKNRGDYYFDVSSATVYIDSFGADAKNVRFDNVVRNNRTGDIEFTLYGASNAKTESVSGKVRVSGTFRDGKYCSGSDLYSSFRVNVKGNTANTFSEPSNWTSGPNTQGSTAYTTAKETQQSGWTNVTPSVTTTYTEPEPNVVEYYAPAQKTETSCTGISIGKENVAVNSGSTKTVYFQFRNYGSEDFVIDEIEGIDYTPEFFIEATRDYGTISSGQIGAIKVKTLASETEKDVSGSAYIKLTGHYETGLVCTATSDNFYVRVNGESTENQLDNFVLDVPNLVEMEGNSGYIEISAENPSNEAVTIKVSSNNVLVSPKEFTISAKSTANRVIAINGFSENDAIVYFNIEAKSKNFLQRYTKLAKPILFEEAEENEVIVAELTAQIEGNGLQKVNVVLANTSNKSTAVSIGLRGIPKEFNSETKTIVLDGLSERAVEISFDAKEAGVFDAFLVVESFGKEKNYAIKVIVPAEISESDSNTSENNNEELSGFEGAVATGFAIVSDNALTLGLLILIILGILLLIGGNKEDYENI